MDVVLTLKKTSTNWILVAPKGHIVYELSPRTTGKDAAYDEAKVWASSWSGVTVRFEDEQGEKRD
jgi:hypothetical protein